MDPSQRFNPLRRREHCERLNSEGKPVSTLYNKAAVNFGSLPTSSQSAEAMIQEDDGIFYISNYCSSSGPPSNLHNLPFQIRINQARQPVLAST